MTAGGSSRTPTPTEDKGYQAFAGRDDVGIVPYEDVYLIFLDWRGGNAMISFENFRSVEGVPIYLQMIRHVKEGLAAGTVRSGDELPSRRVLSATLAVNPNTVQKAYRQLEEEGLIQSRPGAGSCVTASPEQIDGIRKELLRTEVRETAAAMKRMGLKKEEALALLERLYDEEGEE